MDSRIRISYTRRLYLWFLLFLWAMMGGFTILQYDRERDFKAELLNVRLQAVNAELIELLSDSVPQENALAMVALPSDSLRITIIDRLGRVSYDNSLDSLPTGNHLGRNEISAALRDGHGYTVRRHSESAGGDYFYSATAGDSLIVRSALPYGLSLTDVLAVDKGFLWYMFAISLLLSVAGYFVMRRLGHNIRRLRRFARDAERGEAVYDSQPFPHDELGDISNDIVRMYAKLQRALVERDREHRAALHEEREKIRIKKQLTNNINHELKTPIASIQVCLETMMAHPDLDTARRADFLQRCHDNCGRLQRLIADISSLTRMEDGASHVEMAPVDLDQIIAEAIETVTHMAQSKGMDINYTPSPRPLMTRGNQRLLESVFVNLLDNAVAYSGGTQVNLRLDSVTPDAYIFSVWDDGSGVPAEALPHLFERFYRIDKGRSRALGGTGLGLAIVKNAVMLHGGEISVHNRPDGGLQFTFSIMRG